MRYQSSLFHANVLIMFCRKRGQLGYQPKLLTHGKLIYSTNKNGVGGLQRMPQPAHLHRRTTLSSITKDSGRSVAKYIGEDWSDTLTWQNERLTYLMIVFEGSANMMSLWYAGFHKIRLSRVLQVHQLHCVTITAHEIKKQRYWWNGDFSQNASLVLGINTLTQL